jgi:ATP-dependent Clp protease ATP-binding subunit ClpC
VFERFTERSRQVVVFAQDEARLLRHNYIGTEHLLLGLLREEEGLAARVLEGLGITLERTRADVARVVGAGDEVGSGQIPFTPRAKKVLELSLRSALELGHNYIGTEHILLALVRGQASEGVAGSILLERGVDPVTVRRTVLQMLGEDPGTAELDEAYGESSYGISHDSQTVGGGYARTFGTAVPFVVGAVLFAGGLLVGFLIWG